jgi:hypothetical protein
MALPSKSTQASQLGEIHRSTQVVASSSTSHHGPDMGSVATSHIGGGAVWWGQRSELTFQWVQVPSVEITQLDTVVIPGGGKGDQPVGSPEVNVSVRRRATRQVVAQANQ